MLGVVDASLPYRWTHLRELPNNPQVSVFPDRPPRLTLRDTGDRFDLRCPHCAYALRGRTANYCPECGLDLAYEPIAVFTAADISLIWAAALILDRAEISNLIAMNAPDVLQPLPTRRAAMPRIMVPFKFFCEAADRLEAEFGAREFALGQGPLRPEVGPAWPCPGCGEENPGNFDVCWHCGRLASRI